MPVSCDGGNKSHFQTGGLANFIFISVDVPFMTRLENEGEMKTMATGNLYWLVNRAIYVTGSICLKDIQLNKIRERCTK